MRVALSWLRDYVNLPATADGREVAERLLRAGLEVETVERVGDVSGPLVVGRVLDFVEEPQKNGKTIRWCQVRVRPEGTGTEVEPEVRGIVCGAHNFAVGDHVVVALPGTVLPGPFPITARKTYGHLSDGMIASVRELGIGEDHSGILVLDPAAAVGADAAELLGLGDEVLDIAVTPDRGYCLSVRGVAREAATAFDVPWRDPADLATDGANVSTGGYPVAVDDPTGCDAFVAVRVSGFDPAAPSPDWLARRVRAGGMRSISLAVDVTNYVMLELGQPLHAYDAARLTGAIVVRRAREGERLRTLDDVDRALDPTDLLITDGSGPIGLAGVMGGQATEIGERTSEIVIEAAHFDPVSIARTARRHRLPSEASRRFERGVDPAVALAAALRAARLLVEHGGGVLAPDVTLVQTPREPVVIELDITHPTRLVGRPYTDDEVVGALEAVGAVVERDGQRLTVRPPSWRPDLTSPADLVEEVARLGGYDTIPSVLPVAPPGRGLTESQRARRRVGQALAHAGYVEAPSYPFVGESDWAALGLSAGDPRRRALRLHNPLSDEAPALRTTLLPGLLTTLRRNLGRGAADVALFEQGLVFLPRPGAPSAPARPGVAHRPSDEELAALEAVLPDQPRHVAAVAVGQADRAGWWGPGRAQTWADAVAAARLVVDAAGVPATDLRVRAAALAPWHPGRCAELLLTVGGTERVLGHAGELHPRVVANLGLPERTVAMEVDLDLLAAAAGGPVQVGSVSTFPVATQDVALVVDASVAAADVEAALREGAGELLEDLRLFDVYTGEQVEPGHKSLAFALRFRAPDRTLTVEEASAARDAAVAEATRRTAAALRTA
ncbi:MAG TPA: phenylalanine--tRNA ligase subunit beta [Actinomycetes bacterium]|nr:phenylalanine--tRNA ligase subunit beta [Actinomycetes bacterium]